MSTCGTCKHWGSKYDLAETARPCQRIEEHGFWSKNPPIAYLNERDEGFSKLLTRAEFGCILHEPREETP